MRSRGRTGAGREAGRRAVLLAALIGTALLAGACGSKAAAPTPSFCSEVDQVASDMQQRGETEAQQNPAAFLGAIKDGMRRLAAHAPADIAADMKTYDDYVQGLTDLSQTAADQPAEVQAAAKRIQSWSEKTCSIPFLSE